MLGGIIGGIGAAVGGILGAKNNNDANKTNRRIAEQNYELGLREQEFAERQYDDSLLGFSDSFGNSLRFEDGRGWVTTSPIDLVDRRIAESGAADQLLAELLSVDRRDPDVIERERNTAATAGFNTAFDDVANRSLIAANRMGPGTAASVAAKLAKERGTALADILQANAGDAYGQSYREQAGARAPIADLYNVMATRAQGQNSLPTGGTAAALATSAAGGVRESTPQMPYVQPNNAWPTAVTQIGTTLGGLYDNYQQQQTNTQLNSALIEALSSRTTGNQL